MLFLSPALHLDFASLAFFFGMNGDEYTNLWCIIVSPFLLLLLILSILPSLLVLHQLILHFYHEMGRKTLAELSCCKRSCFLKS